MKFIHGKKDVLEKMTEILGGKNGIHVVAYIGSGISKLLNSRSQAKIVCDAENFGSCDPREVAVIIEDSHLVKKYNNLHAKVFVSDKGALIGSKNMTTAGSFEAGIFFSEKTNEFHQILKWATDFFNNKKAKNFKKGEIAELILKREMLDLGRTFFGNKGELPEENQDRRPYFNNFGVAFWENTFTAKPTDILVGNKKDDIDTVKEWYEKFGTNEDLVFQDINDNKYPYSNVIKKLLNKNFISVEFDVTKKNKPIRKPVGIITPYTYQEFKGISNEHYYLTAYKKEKIELDTKKLCELLNGIWTSKPLLKSFKDWKKTESYQFRWMDAKTIEKCAKEYFASKNS